MMLDCSEQLGRSIKICSSSPASIIEQHPIKVSLTDITHKS